MFSRQLYQCGILICRTCTLQEKLRPIDKKLQYQMDKLLRAAAQLHQPGSVTAAAANGSGAAADPLSYGPNPDQLLPRVPLQSRDGGAGAAAEGAGEGLADGNGLYRPPRNVAVSNRCPSDSSLYCRTAVPFPF